MNLQLTLTTPPAAEPVSLAELKANLRVDHDADDAEITRLGKAARECIEQELGKSLIHRTYTLALDGFPAGGGYWCKANRADPSRWAANGAPLRLSRPPLVSVASITYLDAAGQLQTLDPSAYRVLPGDPGALEPAPGHAWPTTAGAAGAMQIQYTAGFGPTAASIPERFRHAIIVTVAAWFDLEDPDTTALPAAASRIINSEGRTYG